jgi:hypothetical protein
VSLSCFTSGGCFGGSCTATRCTAGIRGEINRMNYALTALLVFCLIAWGFVLVPPAVRLFSGSRPSHRLDRLVPRQDVGPGGRDAIPLPPGAVDRPSPHRGRGPGLRSTIRSSISPSAVTPARLGPMPPGVGPPSSVAARSSPGCWPRSRSPSCSPSSSAGPAWLLFTVAMVAFAGYTALLWQMQQRVFEQSDKVAFLPADNRPAHRLLAPSCATSRSSLADRLPEPAVGADSRPATLVAPTVAPGAHVTPHGAVAQLARAPRSHRGGRGFESRQLHHHRRHRRSRGISSSWRWPR